MIALTEAARAGLLHPRHWPANLLAGVAVGLIALPVAMAFAIASGAAPEQGVYTAIIAGLVVAIFGGSRVQVAGPTGAFVIILAGITAEFGIGGLQLASLMAGLMLLAMGFSRLGAVLRYIPNPVIVGFTAGIGIVIAIGQIGPFLGLPAGGGVHTFDKAWHVLTHLQAVHGPTLLLGLASLAILIGLPRLRPLAKVPAALVALLFGGAVMALWQPEGVATIGSAFGGIPAGLPMPHLPDFPLDRIHQLIGPAFAIALLGAIESLMCAVVADGMIGARHNSNQELIGQGAANVLAPLFGGFAATGAIARTAANVRFGATSPIAGVTHALTLVAVLLLAAPLAAYIPLATLAAVLFLVAWNMSELPHLARMLRFAPRPDLFLLLTSLILTVFADLVLAVNVGVIMAALMFMHRMENSVQMGAEAEADLAAELQALGASSLPRDVVVFSIDGPFFFATADAFERSLATTGVKPRAVIIRLGRVPFMDYTAQQRLEAALRRFALKGVRVILTEGRPELRVHVERLDVIEPFGSARCADTLVEALALALPPRMDAGEAPAAPRDPSPMPTP